MMRRQSAGPEGGSPRDARKQSRQLAPTLAVVDAKESDGVVVVVHGALVTITSSLVRDAVTVVVSPNEPGGYHSRWRYFPAIFGRWGQLVIAVWR